MNIQFSSRGWEDYIHWQQFDKKILGRVDLFYYVDRQQTRDIVGLQ